MCCCSPLFQFSSMREGGRKGEFVGVFDVAAGREAATEAGDFERAVFEFSAEIESGEIAFGCRVGGEDDFAYMFLFDAIEERFYVQGVFGMFFGRDVERAAQDEVAPGVAPGSLDGDDVHGFFDDAED